MGPTEQLVAGRFRIEREVGRGGIGTVYRALDTQTQKYVALKIIDAFGADLEEQARLSREGQILYELEHPGIVRVEAFGTLELTVSDKYGRRFDAGSTFVAMEWLDGEDLSDRQRRAPLSLREALDVGKQMAQALAAAHDAGVIHRDIKPSNIFLLKSSSALKAKLVDFGVAASNELMMTTDSGGVVGTPAYMAPEQARGDAAPDARSDIYSLGATLFELIAGRPPHIGPTSFATLVRLATTPAPRLSELMLDVPVQLDELIHAMLHVDRGSRPSTAREVIRELDAIACDPNLPNPSPAKLSDYPKGEVVGTRLVTTIVALHAASGDERQAEIDALRKHGADALPLGVDSIVAHLGIRKAHGDEAVRALELGLSLRERGGRIGVASGRMRVDRTRSAGEVVDRAVALAREAGDGRLLADSITVELARKHFQFEVRPGGSAVVLTQVVERRLPTPFLGRDAEILLISKAFERCVEDQTPVVVSVSGPPGIGKSRLAREFVARIEERDGSLRQVQIRCESFGRAQTLGIAADALRALSGLPKGVSLDQAKEAVTARNLRHNDNDLLPRLLANQPFPEGLDLRGARDELYLSMTELAIDAISPGPCALLVEDAQWADPESVAWFDHLLGRTAGKALFMMSMVRPSFWRDQGQRFAGRDHVRVELRPIARKATREIARAVIEGAHQQITDAMLDQVAQQAAGSPLFAEELARVIASGKDATTAPTIEAAIQVSLDALDDSTREAVVRMSVFGLSVWDQGLTAVGIGEPKAALKRLVASELLVEQSATRFSGTKEFLFKHALVRDVAYASAEDELRQQLHATVARWLDAYGEDSATVAQHFDLGGEHEEAAVRWEAAARRALATNSLLDAVTMADKALVFATDKSTAFARAVLLEEAYSRLDARSSERDSAIRAMGENVFDLASELRTLGARARYEYACGSGTDLVGQLRDVRDRARTIGLVEEEAQCSATLAHLLSFAGEFAMAEQEVSHLLELSERKHLVWTAVDAWQTRAVIHQTRGELVAALEARKSAARAARSARLQEREATLTINVGFALTTIGAREEALQQIEEGIAKAQAIGSSGAVRHGEMILLCWVATFGPEPSLDAVLVEPRAIADEAAGGMWVNRDRGTLGILFYRGCELLRGDASGLARARSLLKTAAEAYRSTKNRDVLPVALGFWAEAERRFGHAERAIELAIEAADLVDSGAPSLLNEAPIYLALHDACVDMGNLAGARDAMNRAFQPLLRRLKGLEGTPYAQSFLLDLSHNAALLSAAEAHGRLPEEIEAVLTGNGE